ncbi:MAG: Fe-S cluster assembly protein SufD [Planctomycetota bacterium]
MTQLATQSAGFSALFERLDSSSPIHDMRRRAFEKFESLGMPTLRDEAWRYTSIKAITEATFTAPNTADVTSDEIDAFDFDDVESHRLVFVNGRYAPGLSSIDVPEGVTVQSLADAILSMPDELEPHLGSLSLPQDQAFIALNTAMIDDGVVVQVSANVVHEKPIHVVFVTRASGASIVTSPRVLIVAERNAQATVIEQHIGIDDGVRLTNTVTEIIAGENAHIEYLRVQRENEATFHTSGLLVKAAQDSTVTCNCSHWGGALVRNEIHAVMEGSNCDVTFNGLTATRGRQHADNNLRIDHMKPHCRSWQYYKSILDDDSKSIFTGRIFVEEDAQKTDAKQTNMSLLLSPRAHVTAKPQLEIFADDVKCTHGATIGEIEPSQLFYLQARGIKAEAARSLLTFAFANEVLQEIPIDGVRVALERLLLSRLPDGDAIRGEL